MKTSSLLAALFLGSTLLTSACTPADKAVTSKDLRLKIQAQNDRKAKKRTQGGNSSSAVRIGFFAMSSLVLDKEIESVELYRLAAEIDKGEKSNTRIENRVEAEGSVTLTISADNAIVPYTTTQGSFDTKLTKKFDVVSKAGELTVTAKNLKQSMNKKEAGKTYANLFENDLTLVAKAKSDTVVEITLSTAGKMEIAKEGQKSFENFKLSMVTEVDKASLTTEEVKVLKSAATLTLLKEEGRTVDVKLEGTNHVLKMQGLCNSLTGTSKILTDKKGKAVSANESQVEVTGSSFKTSLGECGKRPTVDLSKLLMF
ncbi:hypothetical protein ACES2L_09850 [Bdellovibrio bacteriovorus]